MVISCMQIRSFKIPRLTQLLSKHLQIPSTTASKFLKTGNEVINRHKFKKKGETAKAGL
jgi:hypothetical protein